MAVESASSVMRFAESSGRRASVLSGRSRAPSSVARASRAYDVTAHRRFVK
jgi:hypothetical protein